MLAIFLVSPAHLNACHFYSFAHYIASNAKLYLIRKQKNNPKNDDACYGVWENF